MKTTKLFLHGTYLYYNDKVIDLSNLGLDIDGDVLDIYGKSFYVNMLYSVVEELD